MLAISRWCGRLSLASGMNDSRAEASGEALDERPFRDVEPLLVHEAPVPLVEPECVTGGQDLHVQVPGDVGESGIVGHPDDFFVEKAIERGEKGRIVKGDAELRRGSRGQRHLDVFEPAGALPRPLRSLCAAKLLGSVHSSRHTIRLDKS